MLWAQRNKDRGENLPAHREKAHCSCCACVLIGELAQARLLDVIVLDMAASSPCTADEHVCSRRGVFWYLFLNVHGQ